VIEATSAARSSFWIGDLPPSPLVVTITADEGEADAFERFTVAALLVSPTGVRTALTAAPAGDDVAVSWPTMSPFTEAGIYALTLTLSSVAPVAAVTLRATPLRFVVQQEDEWITVDQAREDWPDAPSSDVRLYALLSAAREQCEAYAPRLLPGVRVPARYREAQLMQTAALWQANKTGDGDVIGADGTTVRVYPMGWNVKAVLRPPSGGHNVA
jgi:hypothetical protein